MFTEIVVVSLDGNNYTNFTSSPKYHQLWMFDEYRASWYISAYYTPLCVVFGILGNILTFITLMTASMRRNTTCQFMAYLAIMDIWILTMSVVLMLRENFGFKLLNEWSCGLLNFVFFFPIHTASFLLMAMTIEKYVAVKCPLQRNGKLSTRSALKNIICLSILTALVELHHFFTWIPNKNNTGEVLNCISSPSNKCFITKVWPVIDAAIYSFIPLVFLFMFNLLIIREIHKSSKIQRKLLFRVSVDHTRRDSFRNKTRQDTQIRCMLLLGTFTYLVLACPQGIKLILENHSWEPTSQKDVVRYKLINQVVDSMSLTRHAINLVLYCVGGQNFRNALVSLFCKKQHLPDSEV